MLVKIWKKGYNKGSDGRKGRDKFMSNTNCQRIEIKR